MTHERELRHPVDLCTPDGRRLAPEARGWSRHPLHRANLRGSWGRTKRWDYWAVLAGDIVVSVTYADVDYLGIASVWWAHLPSGRAGGREVIVPFSAGITLPQRPGSAPLHYAGRRLRLDLGAATSEGTRLVAAWDEPGGVPARLDVTVTQPPGHESLNVVIPWSDTRFQYTSKHQARPAHGVLEVGDTVHVLGGEGAPAWGVLDVGRGRWPYRTRWNWGGGAGLADTGAVVGLQLGGQWTAGTGFTENGILVDGSLTKIGEELTWHAPWEDPLSPWTVRAPDGSVDLRLESVFDRHARTQAVVLATEVHQVFGRWSGTVTDADGRTHRVEGIQGFAEESRSRW